jgi:hypothetical protein
MQVLPSLYSTVYNTKVEKPLCFATIGVSIIAASFYKWGTYGQTFKFAKKLRTLILRKFSTFEKYSLSVQLCKIFNIEKCCPEMPHLLLHRITSFSEKLSNSFCYEAEKLEQ